METVSLTISLSGEQIEVIRNTQNLFCVRGWDSERHSNVADELHIILSGSCQMEVDEACYDIQPGMAILILAGQFHMSHHISSNIERVALMLKADGQEHIRSLLLSLSGQPFFLSQEVISMCYQLDRDSTSPQPFHEEMIAAKLTQILIEILRTASPVRLKSCILNQNSSWQLNMAQIDEFFSPWPEAIGSEMDLARKLQLSRHQLNRIIQQNYGMSFRQKLKLAKMDYASWLLRSTSYSCSQIAALCGYTAESSFYKAFGAFFKMSPQTYRKNYRKIP